MSDSKENEKSNSIDEQLNAALCTVLKYDVILPADFGSAWEDDAVEKLSEAIKQQVIVWSKSHPGARLVYNAAHQLSDGLEIPLI